MAAPVMLVADEREGEARLERIPPERRGALAGGRRDAPERAAEILADYVDAGFGGFTVRQHDAVANSLEPRRRDDPVVR